MTYKTEGFVRHFRRAGPPALLAACLAAGPAFAQTTVIEQDRPATTETKIKEKKNGDVVVKEKTRDDDDVTKSKTIIKDDPSTTTTTTTVR